jgi:hypothetical protein
MYPWNDTSGMTLFEDNFRRRPVLEIRPNALRVHTLPEERDALADAVKALRYLTPFTAYGPAQKALDDLDALSAETSE